MNQISQVEPELQYLYDTQYAKFSYMIGRNYLHEKKLKVDIVENGIVFPSIGYFDNDNNYKYKGGVADRNGKFIENSGLYKTPDHNKHALTLSELPDYSEKDIKEIDETIVYNGSFIYHWGHFLFECTTRLWYYLQHDCQNQGIKLAIACLSKPLDNNFKEFYDLLNIKKENILYIEQPTRFKKVIVPEPSSILGYFYTNEFLLPFDRIRDNVKEGSEKRIYMTRTKLSPNNTIGEETIEKSFSENDYYILAPEQVSLKKMVSLVKGAEIVAGLSGSNTHNLIFARSGINAVIMNRFGEDNNPQELVHKARSINAIYVDSFSTFLPVTHGGGPFLVSVNDNLFRWLKDNRMKVNGINTKLSPEKVVEFLTEWATINKDEFKTAILCNLYTMKDCVEIISQFFKKEQSEPEKLIQKTLQLKSLRQIIKKFYWWKK